jgi:hypothetical protein
MRDRLSGPRDRATVQAAHDLAEALLRLGRVEQARQTIDPAVQTALDAFGPEDPVTRAAVALQRRAAGE